MKANRRRKSAASRREAELDSYIRRALEKGYSPAKVKSSLIRAGWRPRIINSVLDREIYREEKGIEFRRYLGIALIMILTLSLAGLIAFSNLGFTGAFIADNIDWENKIDLQVNASQQSISYHIIFGNNKPENCADGIYIETSDRKIDFGTENEIYTDGKCAETDVVFDNLIYKPVKENITPSKNEIPITAFAIFEGTETITYTIYYGKSTKSEIPVEIPKEVPVSEAIQESTIQSQAVIGQPVKWTRNINLAEPTHNYKVVLPKYASDIKVRDISEDKEISYEEIPEQELVGIESASLVEKKEREIILRMPVQKIEIEYQTPAPIAIETSLEKGKKTLTVSSEFNYTNILAYSNIPEAETKDEIKLYHLSENGKETIDFNPVATNGNGLIDRIEWIVPHLSNQSYEISLTIINVQSYPTVTGNWTVFFNTTGQADLRITAVEGTTWTNYSDENYDLKFLELKCGANAQSYEWLGSDCTQTGNCSVFIQNYTCDNKTGNEISLVITPGEHTLEFDFGGIKKTAKNYAVLNESILTISGTTILCGEVKNYTKIVVTSTGVLNICPRNGAGTGYVNITLGAYGNFTVESGGKVLGNSSGATGGLGSTATAGKGTQGMSGDKWTAGAQSVLNNSGGGGGGNKTAGTNAGSGAGGGFGGGGGQGANESLTRGGMGGGTYGSASSSVLLAGSGGGGGAGDLLRNGSAGGAGFKVDAGSGYIQIAGTINMSAESGQSDAASTDAGGGGGGSGGHIILRAYTMNISGAKLDASGGRGGASAGTGVSHCGGGGGGGGRIVVLYGTIENTSTVYLAAGGLAGATGAGTKPGNGTNGTVYHAADSFGNSAVFSVNMTSPASDITPNVDDTFVMNCTPITGGLPNGVNMSYEYNSSTFKWKPIETAGSVNLTINTGNSNPEVSVRNNTLYTATVTVKSAGNYNVRCRLYNSTTSINSSIQQVTVLNWWDAYAYSLGVSIKNNVAMALTNYQVNITINTAAFIAAGKMNSSCKDIRFVNSTNSLIDFWIEEDTCNSTTTKLWVKVPRIPASGTENITMYYGNPSAAAGKNGDATFLFFDDFNGASLNTTKWTTGNYVGEQNCPFAYQAAVGYNTPAVTNGYLNFSGARSATDNALEDGTASAWWGRSVKGNLNISEENFTVEAYYWFDESSSGVYTGFYTEFTLGVGADKDNYIDGKQQYNNFIGIHREVSNTGGDASTVAHNVALQTWKRVLFEFKNGAALNSNYTIDGASASYSVGQTLTSKNITIGFNHRAPSAIVNQWVDWIFARKYTSIEPTASIIEVQLTSDVYSVTLNQPTSDPNINVTQTFGMNCTAITGGASTGVNISYEYNSSEFAWKAIGTSGYVNLTVSINPRADIANNTMYNATITGHTADAYNIRCRAYNSTTSIYSANQTVTVNALPFISSDEAVNVTSIFVGDYFCVNATITNEEGNLNASSVVAQIWNTTSYVNVSMSNATGGPCGAGGDVFGASIQATASGVWNYSYVFASDLNKNNMAKDISPDLSVNVYYRPDVINVTLNQPISDLDIYIGNTFTINCTAITGGASTGINVSYEYNSSAFAWKAIETSGSVNLTTTSNPQVNVANNTMYNATVTGQTAGAYNVRCRAYNSTTSVYSGTRQVTANPHTYVLNITSPLQGSPVQVTDGQNITVNFTFTRDGTNITSNMNVTSILVGGQVCTLQQGQGLYSKSIAVKNNLNYVLTDFQVNVTLDTATLISAGKMQSDCDDIRFTNSTGSQIPYWIKTGTCNTTSTEIWVKVPRIPAPGTENITMSYGSPSASAGSNGTATFILFDDFEGCSSISPFCFIKYSGNPVFKNTSSNDPNYSYDARGMREVFIMQVINETTYEKTYNENGVYRMFYNSVGNTSGDQWFTSLATSTDKYNWTRSQAQITKNFTYKSWDSVTRQASLVYKYNGTYYLYHVSSNSTTADDAWSANCPVAPYRTGLATTTNVSNMSSWVTQNSGNPILDIVPGTPYSNWVAASELLRDPSNSSQWLMFASGADATYQRLMRFKSVDLVNWTYVGLLTGQHDTTGEENPKIVKADDGNYYMISDHIEGDHTDSNYLYKNASANLSSWTYLGTVIGASGSGWDAVTIGMDGYIYENSILWIYYDAGPTTGHGGRQIGISKNGGIGGANNWTAGPGGQAGGGGPGVWSVETKDGSSRMSLLDGLDPSQDTLYTSIGMTANYTIEGNLMRDSEVNHYYSGFTFRFSNQQNFYMTFIAYYENVLTIAHMLSGTVSDVGANIAKTISPNTYYNLSLSVFTNSTGGTNFTFVVDGTTRTGADNQITTSTNVGMYGLAGDYGQISKTWYDDFRVRKYASVQPNVTLGTETSQSLQYSNATGIWSVNCTVPSDLNGLQNLYVEANATAYSGGIANDTEVNAVSYPAAGTPDVYSVTLNQPASDPNIFNDGTFGMNCTVITSGSTTGINISFEYNSTEFGWKAIETSGSVNFTTASNPAADVRNNSMHNKTVTTYTAGTYNVRCRAYNSSTSVYSGTQQVTVNQHIYALNITSPLQINPIQVTDRQNITVNFTFTRDGTNITSNVNVTNVLVGGQVCTLQEQQALYSKSIAVKNNLNYVLTDFQVNVTINTSALIAAGEMQSDCDDIRFTNSTGSQIPYWIKTGTCNTTSTEIWVKVPRIPPSGTENITMSYGNPSASAGGNGTATFIFFDDFEGPCNSITPLCFSKYTGNPVINKTDVNLPYDYRGVREVNIVQIINETTYEKTYNENGIYRMFYNSVGNKSGDEWFASMAESTDLYNWTRKGLVTKNFTRHVWDNVTIGSVTVIKFNGTYYMYFMGSNITTLPNSPYCNCQIAPYRMGLATTTNISNMSSWVLYPGNPILDIKPGTPYSDFIVTTDVLRDPTNSSQWLMFGAGSDATANRLLYLKSANLVNWTYVGLLSGQYGISEENPRIIKADDGNYYMLSNHIHGNFDYTDSESLYRNASADLSSWTYLGAAIVASSSGWDSVTIGMSAPVYENGTMWIFYDGGSDTTHCGRQMGVTKTGGVGTDKWTIGSGNWTTELKNGSNRAMLRDGPANSYNTLYKDIGITANYTIEGTVMRDSEAHNYYSGFVFRRSNQQNFYASTIHYIENNITITRMLGGTWAGYETTIAKTISPNVYYNLSLSVYTNSSGGTSFNWIVDGTNRSGSDNQLTTATEVGLWANAGNYGEISSTWWDDFSVRKWASIAPDITIGTGTSSVLQYDNATGVWSANCTAPSDLNGLQNLYVEANATAYSDALANDTEIDAVQYQALATPAVYSVTLNQPVSDPSIFDDETFNMNCTAITGGALTGVNISFEYNSSTFGWKAIETSGNINFTTASNPAINIINSSMHNRTVTAYTAGTYNVRCRAYNSTTSVYSANQTITVRQEYIYAKSSFDGSSTINVGQSTVFGGNCTCTTGATCNAASIIVQDNSTGAFQISNTSGSAAVYTNVTDYYIGTLTGTSANYYFNISGTAGQYGLRVQCNASTDVANNPANSTASVLTINQLYGWLNATLITPTGVSNSQPQNSTFTLIANVSCVGEAIAICGNVNGTVRYNLTTANPDTTIQGWNSYASPFYTIEENPLSCGAMTVDSTPCMLNWTVNATGEIGSAYKIDVNFTSNNANIVSNKTNYTIIKIISPSLNIILSNALANVFFGGALNPGTTGNNATNNTVQWYNITCNYPSGNCNVSIKGNVDFKSGPNTLGITNVSWNQVNDNNTANVLNYTYNVINETLANLMTQKIFFWLDIPPAQVAGAYTANYTILGQPN